MLEVEWRNLSNGTGQDIGLWASAYPLHSSHFPLNCDFIQVFSFLSRVLLESSDTKQQYLSIAEYKKVF